MDSFHPLELGALRSYISLTLHTFHAALIWRGRTARPGARPILGMAGYIQITHQLKQAAARDDPYADWAMCQLEAKLETAKARIGELIQHLERIHQDRPGQVAVGENLNQHPVILPLFIGSPLGFLGVYLLTDYDVLARRALLAHHTALISQQDMVHILDSGAHQLRGLFTLAQRCKPSGLSREDFRANHAEAQAVRARLGQVPDDILSGVRRSQYAPTISQRRDGSIANLHPGESAT